MRCFSLTQIISVLLFCLSANLDTLVIAVSYGMRHIKIPLWSNAVISLITTLGTLAAMLFGRLLSGVFPPALTGRLGGAVLIILGLWFLLDECKKIWEAHFLRIEERETPPDLASDGALAVKAAVPLAAALTVNNLGMGIAASIAEISIVLTSIATFASTVLFLLLGSWLGRRKIFRRLGRTASLCSALLLTALGIYECFV